MIPSHLLTKGDFSYGGHQNSSNLFLYSERQVIFFFWFRFFGKGGLRKSEKILHYSFTLEMFYACKIESEKKEKSKFVF